MKSGISFINAMTEPVEHNWGFCCRLRAFSLMKHSLLMGSIIKWVMRSGNDDVNGDELLLLFCLRRCSEKRNF